MASFLDFAAALTGPRQYFAGRLDEQDEARKRAEQLALLRELGLLGGASQTPAAALPAPAPEAPSIEAPPVREARTFGGGQDYATDAVENPLVDLQPFRREAARRLLAPGEAQTFPYQPPQPLAAPQPISGAGGGAVSPQAPGLSQNQYLQLLPVLGAGNTDKLNEFLLRQRILSSPEFQGLPLGRQANLALGEAKPDFTVKDHQAFNPWTGEFGGQTTRGASLSAADRALAGQRRAIGARSAAAGQIMARDTEGNEVPVTPVTRPDGSVVYLPATLPQGFSIPAPEQRSAPAGGARTASEAAAAKPGDTARQLKDARAHAKDMVGVDRWGALTEDERRALTERYRRELYPESQPTAAQSAPFEWNGNYYRRGDEITEDGIRYLVIGRAADGSPAIEPLPGQPVQ